MKSVVKTLLSVVLIIAFMLSPLEALSERQANWFRMIEQDYLGKNRSMDQDNYAGAQCVDVASHYANYIFPDEQNSGSAYKKTLNFGNANELYSKARNEYFQKIPYVKGAVPMKGDIVVWGKPGTGRNRHGHVAVVDSADNDKMVLIHQNGSGAKVVFKQETDYHSLTLYNGDLIGFLRPIGSDVSDSGDVSNPYLDELQGIETPKEDTRSYDAPTELKLISGSSLHPSDELDRIQALTFAIKLSGKEKFAKEFDAERTKLVMEQFEDASDVPSWARPYLAYAIEEKMISGVSVSEAGKIVFKPKDGISGSAFSTLLFRSLGYRVNSPNDAKILYKDMIAYQNSPELLNEPEELRVTNKDGKEIRPEETTFPLLNKNRISRNEGAKIMFDFLSYAQTLGSAKEKRMSLKEHLVLNNVFDRNAIKKSLEIK